MPEADGVRDDDDDDLVGEGNKTLSTSDRDPAFRVLLAETALSTPAPSTSRVNDGSTTCGRRNPEGGDAMGLFTYWHGSPRIGNDRKRSH